MKAEQEVDYRTEGESTSEEHEKDGNSLFHKIRTGLSVLAQVALAMPVKLPPAVMDGAKYVALLLTLLDSADQKGDDKEED